MILFRLKNIKEVIVKLIIAALVISLSLHFSCSGKQRGITEMKIGEKEQSEAYIGLLLPVKAVITLNEKIESIEVKIAASETNDRTFNKRYTEKYGGYNIATFDEDIEIPSDAEVGDYELILTVTGESGATAEKRRNIKISVDSTIPTVGDLDVGINAKGNDLHLETDITAAKKLKQVIVAIKGKEWSKDFVFDKPTLTNQLSYSFHEHVHVDEAPVGEYEVMLTVEDQEGRKASTTNSFHKKKVQEKDFLDRTHHRTQ